MAIYRIVRWDKPPQDEQLEPWQQKPSRRLARDLDLQEIEQLNQQPDEEIPTGRRLKVRLIGIIIVVAAAAFVFMSYANIINLEALPDLGFLHQSQELSTDPMVADLKEAVVSVEAIGSRGTGFNIDPSGVIVTNKHVVDDAKLLCVTFPDGSQYYSRQWRTYDNADLALIYVKGEGLPCVSLAEKPLAVGDTVIFIGNPLGFDWTVGQGKVLDSSVSVNGETEPVVLLEGSIYPGSSGSPVFNQDGDVAAVVFATLSGQENTGLAIPIEQLYQR